MKIEIVRKTFTDRSTIGKMSLKGLPAIYTLEDKMREIPGEPVSAWKIPGKTAIPVGTYPLVIDWSFRFKKYMFHLLDVPGFDGIRIHAGNTPDDTEGCILVGMYHDYLDTLEQSRVALAMLWAKLAVPALDHTPDKPHWEICEPSTVTITNSQE